MKIEEYQAITSSTAAYTTTSSKNSASDASFEDVFESAAERLASKVCNSVDNSAGVSLNSDSGFSFGTNTSDLMKKLAKIQIAIEEANAQKKYVPSSSSETTEDSVRQASVVSHTANNCDVYNEGKLCCSDELNEYFLKASETYGVDVKLLKSVAFVESSFRADATSKCGAMGIMQLMPSAAKQYGAEEPYDPEQNIMAGAKILSTFLKRYDGDVELTLAAYNAGPGNVKKAGGVPSYAEGYVNKVLKYYNL